MFSLISGGCNSYATKLNTKTANSSERHFSQSATTIPAWSKRILITLVLLTMLEGFSLHVEALPTQTRTRRHGKRYAQNTVSVAETLKQDHLTNVWDNPCTGEYIVNPNIKYRLKNKMKVSEF